jgi:hypothetical protein
MYNINGYCMFAGGPGVWTVPILCEIKVERNWIRVYKACRVLAPLTGRNYFDFTTVAIFLNAKEFIDWCTVNGRLSGVAPTSELCD